MSTEPVGPPVKAAKVTNFRGSPGHFEAAALDCVDSPPLVASPLAALSSPLHEAANATSSSVAAHAVRTV